MTDIKTTQKPTVNYGTEPLELPQQEEYAQEFVTNGFNSRKAAISVGYSEKNLDNQVHRFKFDPKVRARIAYLIGLRLRQTDLTIDDFVLVIKQQLNFDIKRIFDGEGHLIPPDKLPAEVSRCLTGIDVTQSYSRGNTECETCGQLDTIQTNLVKYKTEGKFRFLALLGQYLTTLVEILNRTDATELQRTWSKKADEIWEQYSDQAIESYEKDQAKYKKGPPDVENTSQTEVCEPRNIEAPIVKDVPPERGTARIEDPHLKLGGGNRCPHRVAMTDYCEPCGRIHGG